MLITVGNNGQPPVDDIDECCQQHDNCYDNVMTSGTCELPHPMLVSYSWSMVSTNHDDGGTLLCDDCATESGWVNGANVETYPYIMLTGLQDRGVAMMTELSYVHVKVACVIFNWPIVYTKLINVHHLYLEF